MHTDKGRSNRIIIKIQNAEIESRYIYLFLKDKNKKRKLKENFNDILKCRGENLS